MIALGRVLQTLREEKTLDQLVAATLNYVKAEFEYAVLWIGLYDRLNHQLIGKGGRSPKGNKFFKQPLKLHPGDLMEQVVMQQRPLLVPDLRAELRVGEWRNLAKSLNIQATLIFPIRHRNLCYGSMLLGSDRWGVSPKRGERARLSMVLGTLADALHQLEVEQRRRQIKQPDRPLLTLLEQFGQLDSLERRLEVLAEETHHFIQPCRTHIYWFAAHPRYFWRRVSHRQGGVQMLNHEDRTEQVHRILVEEDKGFYQSLCADKLVVIGEANSSIKANVTQRFMQKIQAGSLLAAPILFQGEPLGFLSVEGEQARIWTNPEKTYLHGAARLVALSMPMAEMESTLRQVKTDQALTAQITRSIHSDRDWNAVLDICVAQLNDQLSTDRLFVMLHDADRGGFDVGYHNQPTAAGPVQLSWPPLDEVDWRMLEQSTTPISIEDLEDDLKLMAWRLTLLQMGVRSLLVCNVSFGYPPEGLLIVTDRISRRWSRPETALVETVSQQIGLILHQWRLQQQVDQHGQIYETLRWGMQTLQQTTHPDQLDQVAVRHIARMLQVPLAALISWERGGEHARITERVIRDNDFALDEDEIIAVNTDTLINWALQTDGVLPLNLEDLPDITRRWFSAPSHSKILIATLRTAPEHTPNAVLVAADRSDRRWSEYHLNVLTILVGQLAWSRRHLYLQALLSTQREKLESLNWCKQKQIDEIYRLLDKMICQLNALSFQKEGLPRQQYQQIIRQLGGLLGTVASLVNHEPWRLSNEYSVMRVPSLLNRLIERTKELIKNHQLWTQVHNDTNLSISGDIAKIEFVLYELLSNACERSPVSGRIDIWCRSLDSHWLELSITDSGEIDPNLLKELHSGRPKDILTPSLLDEPPGLHFLICQTLMQQMGGEFNLLKLEDSRLLSRVILPISTGAPISEASAESTPDQAFL